MAQIHSARRVNHIYHHPTYTFILASHKRIKLGMVGMNSKSLIYWSNPPLIAKVGLNPPQLSHNMHMGHHMLNSKLGRV